jgi:NAD(P)-dependent dehydrogenase (short-subunit alcohol dehydrogenase family)
MRKKIAIYGSSSAISCELVKLCGGELDVINYSHSNHGDKWFDALDVSIESLVTSVDLTCEFYVFNLGLLRPKGILDQTTEEINESLSVNLIYIVKATEYIIERNSKAKIFVFGSESGKKGSFDTVYFLAKAALRAYVFERKLKSPDQQLVLFSPSTIEDAGMTLRRKDKGNLEYIKSMHPKNRFLKSLEFARIVYSFIVNDFSYITNTEIEVNGGKFARM